jgi:carbonic anhydrase/acetyltransferase-like protein (isoleucine patch superfamily)
MTAAPPIILPFKGVLPTIDADAWIAPGAVVIGDAHIGAQSSIWFGCVVRADVFSIRIGKRTNIQDGTVVHVTGGRFATVIGDDVLIGHQAMIHGCTLEDGAFVGMGATVMDGCVVAGGGMVAAGALLTPGKKVARGEVWGGNPARAIRGVTDAEIEQFKWATAHYAALAAEYKQALT